LTTYEAVKDIELELRSPIVRSELKIDGKVMHIQQLHIHGDVREDDWFKITLVARPGDERANDPQQLHATKIVGRLLVESEDAVDVVEEGEWIK
jgi:hypothetical protein